MSRILRAKMEDNNAKSLSGLYREVNSLSRNVAVLESKMQSVRDALDDLVSKAEFMPVKLIAYGLAAGCMGAVITALISSVITK